MRRHLISAILILFISTASGCADRYSQDRIKMRQESMRGLSGDIQSMEKHRIQRLREMAPSIQKWWHDDVDLWNERAPTVGDYVL